MVTAKRQIGGTNVSPGYKVKKNQAAREQVSDLRRALNTLREAAREMRAFTADEIAYATIDTLRLLGYLRYELRLTPQRRPVRQQDWELEV